MTVGPAPLGAGGLSRLSAVRPASSLQMVPEVVQGVRRSPGRGPGQISERVIQPGIISAVDSIVHSVHNIVSDAANISVIHICSLPSKTITGPARSQKPAAAGGPRSVLPDSVPGVRLREIPLQQRQLPFSPLFSYSLTLYYNASERKKTLVNRGRY